MCILNVFWDSDEVFCCGCRDIHGISTSGERVFSWLMIILAIVTSVFAISTNIYSLVSHRS